MYPVLTVNSSSVRAPWLLNVELNIHQLVIGHLRSVSKYIIVNGTFLKIVGLLNF